MRIAYVHIGMHKTGSSSIQGTLAQNLWPEHHYVQVGPPNHSVMMQTVFNLDPNPVQLRETGLNRKDIENRSKKWREDLVQELENNTKPNVILSGENFSGNDITEGALKDLHGFLRTYVDRVQIIAYVRPPVSLMESSFQQRVKSGRMNGVRGVPVRYRSRLEKFDTEFGRENVDLIKFDKSALLNGDAVQDFANRIGVELDPEQISTKNQSLSLEAIALLYVGTKFGADFGKYPNANRDRNAAIKTLSGIGSRKLRFGSGIAQTSLDECADEIDWVEERLGTEIRDLPKDGDDAIQSEQDLLDIAAANADKFVELLAAEVGMQEDPIHKVAETLDMMRILQITRREIASGDADGNKEKRMAMFTKADREERRAKRQAQRKGKTSDA